MVGFPRADQLEVLSIDRTLTTDHTCGLSLYAEVHEHLD